MNRPRQVAGVTVFLLLVPIILGGLSVSGCKTVTQVIVEPDPRVFTLFSGLLAGGCGSSHPGAILSPTQQRVLEALGSLDPAERAAWERLLNDWTEPVAPEFLLTDGVLAGGGPPDFTGLAAPGAPPSLQGCLESLWASNAKTLYDATLEAHTQMGTLLASTAQDTVKQVLAYAHVKTPFDSVQVIPNPLAWQGFSRSWLDPETRTAYVVLGPDEGDLTLALARETFRLCLNESLFQDLEASDALESLKRVFELSRAGLFGQDRCGTLADFLRENLARACALRAFLPSPEDTAAALAAEWDNGFALVQDFYVALGAGFESGEKSLADTVGELVSVARASDVADRMDDRLAPEGYPVLPEGWEWARREGFSQVWYDAVGATTSPLRMPFDGWYCSVARLSTERGTEWGLKLVPKENSDGLIGVWGTPSITTRPADWPPWEELVYMEKGDTLPVVGEVSLGFVPPPSSLEGMEDILRRLLGNE